MVSKMKAVLISIQPKWVEKITNGEKTIEVRKTAPKQVPFKCYIYCTKSIRAHVFHLYINGGIGRQEFGITGLWRSGKKVVEVNPHLPAYRYNSYLAESKVIGEFVCDKIEDFKCASVPYKKENNLGYGHFVDNGVYKVNGWFEGVVFERNDKYIDTMLKNKDLSEMCLSAQQLFDYIGIGKHFYGWHISDLKIYDKPKELSEFYTKKTCNSCKKSGYESTACIYDEDCKVPMPITRAPQSWQYVEELEE